MCTMVWMHNRALPAWETRKRSAWLGQGSREGPNQGCTQDRNCSKAGTEHHCRIAEVLLFVVPEEIPLAFRGATVTLFQLNGFGQEQSSATRNDHETPSQPIVLPYDSFPRSRCGEALFPLWSGDEAQKPGLPATWSHRQANLREQSWEGGI